MAIKKVVYQVGDKFIDTWSVTRTIVSIDKNGIHELERDVPNGLPNATVRAEHITSNINLERWVKV